MGEGGVRRMQRGSVIEDRRILKWGGWVGQWVRGWAVGRIVASLGRCVCCVCLRVPACFCDCHASEGLP